ncbi:hypothetical protein ADH76_22520 [Enterocloster clostridioformis]|nr:hypothetical protein [Enterocloster clostridioformis]ANU46360.1 hypothetical protein A4V08_11655 [Lachnoclostridium sp. YL32]OXE65077.1 hypothetical protein ADH76_22520 [Enterocloster clostridioformis]
MGWLIQMLLEAVREQCSQFIIDMMEIVNQVFTELLSCNLDLFEELFSVVKDLYREAIVPLAIAILLLIFIWQLLKGMFGKYLNSEDPMELVIRSCICLFMVTGAKSIVNYVLDVAGTPYDWVTGTQITVVSFADFTSVAEAVTSGLGIDSLNIQLLLVIIQFMVSWNYLKLLFIMAERYVLLGVFSYTAPLAFATGGSKATNNILASWSKMFGGQVVLIILDAWCLKVYLSGYGFTKFFAATLCLVGFGKIVFKLDSYMASLGVNLGRTSPGMGGLGLMMMLGRVFSQFGGSSVGHGSPSGGRKGPATGAGSMASGVGSPIPMGGPGASGMGGKPSNGADSAAMAGNGPDMGVPMSGQKNGEPQEKPHGMPKDSAVQDNQTFGADMDYGGNAAIPAENFDGAVEADGNSVETGPFDSDDTFEAANMGGAFSDYDSIDANAADSVSTVAGDNVDKGMADGMGIGAGDNADTGMADGMGIGAGDNMDTGMADSMSIGAGDSVDTGITDSLGTMNADGGPFDDSSVAGSGITFDSGYQSADLSEGTDGSVQGGSVASGGQESGHLQMADAQGVSGNPFGSDAGVSGNKSVAGQNSMTAEAGSSITAQTGAAGSAEPGRTENDTKGSLTSSGVSIPDNRGYQQLEHDGVKYARFAADEYEKPNTSHQVVEADGKRFYEVKLEPVQSGIKATLQKDGKVHYEKTYKEVLPEVPKRKQKAAPNKENPSGKQAKGKNGSKQNKGR